MKKEVLPLPQAWEMGMQLPWVYLRSLSRVYLGKTPEGLTMDELLEARFFSNLEEIRIFLSEDGLKAVRLEEEAADSILEEEIAVNSGFGSSYTVHYLLEADEDGQTSRTVTRLAGWKGENENG